MPVALFLNLLIVCVSRTFAQRTVIVSCEVVKQADGLLVELVLSFCYDYVELSCDFVLKHLSIIQKQR